MVSREQVFLQVASEAVDEGLVLIDSDGYILLYNQQARAIFGLTPQVGPGHKSGKIEQDDYIVLINNRLGGDDGYLTSKDLAGIGVPEGKVNRGEGCIIMGRQGARPGSAVVKIFNEEELADEPVRQKLIIDQNISLSAELDPAHHVMIIDVNGRKYKYFYKVTACHMLVLSSKGEVKFYQTKGYTARQESAGELLRGNGFAEKGPEATDLALYKTHITEIHPYSQAVELLLKVARGEIGAIHSKDFEINGVSTLCTIYPVNHGQNYLGAVMKVSELEELRDLLDKREMALDNQDTFQSLYKQDKTFDGIFSNSKEMQDIIELCDKVKDTNSTILINGESGTGKSLLAKGIHRSSHRSDRPFVVVNCASIPENLLETELFGYEAGAFTGAMKSGKPGKFAVAHGGTILLEEIGELTPSLQAKLLYVIQEKQITPVGGLESVDIDVRIIATTNRELEREVTMGNFREDLYYRINVIQIQLPPLRDRKQDIPALVKQLLPVISERVGKQVTNISHGALKILKDYSWPGNVRELENALERAINVTNSDTVCLNHLPEKLNGGKINDEHETPHADEQKVFLNELGKIKDLVSDLEQQALAKALDRSGGNKTKAMKILDMSRANFYKKLRYYQLE